MNSIKHLRLLGLITSAAAIAAFGVPSTALAGKSHHLSPYKVEDHVELEGEESEYTLSCKAGDIAVDGMWRVDNVDQDNDWEDPDPSLAAFWGPVGPESIGTSPDLTIRKAIRPMAAYADAANVSKYHFEFTPLAGADAQLKLFLTCLPEPLTGHGHNHDWRFEQDPDADDYHSVNVAIPAGPSVDPGLPATAPYTATCPAKTVLIEPGFKTAYTNQHVVMSRPNPTSWNGRSWDWKVFDDGTNGGGGTVTLSWRCLDVKSSGPLPTPNSGHTHKLVLNKKETTFNNSVPAVNPHMGPQQIGERQQHCGEHYKALLGGWDVTDPWRQAYAGAGPDYPHHMWVYFLGMDPRPKTRAFKFLNTDEIPGTVTTAAVCFKDRTT